MYKMNELYIRLNNKFVVKIGKRYYSTNIKSRKEWMNMNKNQRERCKKEDITDEIKSLLRKYGSKSNVNFNTKKKKRLIKKTKRKLRKLKKKGGG